jgi:ribosomal protein S13
LCDFTGYSYWFAKSKKKYSYINDRLDKFLLNNKNNLNNSLKKKYEEDILNKIKVKTYQGYRLKNRLPSRGQRTKSNARSVKRSSIIFLKK